MSRKIYNEIISQFNEKTQKWETIYEDSFIDDGEIMLALDMEDDFNESWDTVSKNLGKKIIKEMRKASTIGASSFDKDFASTAGKLTVYLKNAVKAGNIGESIAREVGSAVQDVLAGAGDAFEMRKASKIFNALASKSDIISKNLSEAGGGDGMEAAKQMVVMYESMGDDAAKQMQFVTGLAKQFGLTTDQAGKFLEHMKDGGAVGDGMKQSFEAISKDMTGLADTVDLKEMEKNFEDSIESGITGALDFIPSNAFTKALGIDQGIEMAAQNMASKFTEHGAKVGSFLKNNWGKALAVGAMMGLMVALNNQTNAIGENFGGLAANSGEFKSTMAITQGEAARLGFEVDDVVTSANALSESLGIGNTQAVAMTGAVLDTAKATAMGVDETSKLIGSLMSVTGMSADAANNFTKATFQLAEASNVAPKQVLEDIAASSEDVAKFTKGSGDNIAEAAVKAAKLGLSLSDVASVAEGLLDFQSSIESEMTAAALIGRDLNLQRARELALVGDMVGLQDELLNQVGSQAEFEAMNVIERKALADAIGLSVSQVAKLTQEAGKSREEMMGLREFSGEELVGSDAIGNVTRLTNMFKMLGTTILGQVGAAFENMSETDIQGIASDFKDVGTALGEIIAFTIEWGKWILIAYGSFKLFQGLQWLSGAFSGVAALTTAGPIAGVGPSLMSLAAGLKSMGNAKVLMGVLAMGLFAPVALMSVAAIPFLAFMSLPFVAMIGATLTALSVGLLALGSGGGPLFLGILALGLLAAAMIPAAYAFSLLAGVDPLAIVAFSGSIIILGLAMMGLGMILGSGIGAIVFGIGIAGLIALGGAVMLLGSGLATGAPHIGTFTVFMSSLGDTMTSIQPNISSVNALSDSLYSLSGSLTAVGLSGLLALPILAGLQAFNFLGTGKSSEGKKTEGTSETDTLKTSIDSMKTSLDTLVAGFTEGTFTEAIGKATGKHSPTSIAIKDPLFG